MNELTINTNPVNVLPRCEHLTPTGRRCRQSLSDPTAVLCPFHLRLRQRRRQASSADLSAELTAGLPDFKSAEAVNDFLSRLLVLQAQGRIAPRRAAVMIFNCNQILHSLTAILRENPPADDVAPTVVWDIPGLDPVRGSEPDPPPSHPHQDTHAYRT